MVTGAFAFGGASALTGSSCLIAWEIAGIVYRLMLEWAYMYCCH
jgi:hypothetical protein